MLSECRLAIRVPDLLREKIKAEAARRMVSSSDVVREAVLQYFNELDATRREDRKEFSQ